VNTKPNSPGRVKRRRRVRCAPLPGLVAGTEPLASSAGGTLLVQAARASGLDRGLRRALSPWRAATAVHHPGKVVLDLASALALGADCLADVAVVRAQPAVFGSVASDPTVSRTVDRLAATGNPALAAVADAVAAARAAAWTHRCPVPTSGAVMVDLDATVVVAHSEKQSAAPTFKRTFGFHPLFAFVDHDPATGAGGEVLAGLLRPGNANANSAADHITVLDQALEQLPGPVRARVVVRADGGGGTKAFLTRITNLGLQYSIGIGTAIGVDQVLLARLPKAAWTQAYDPDGRPRESAQVAELTGLLPELTGRGWPARMRVIARRERPHPGAQLRLTDVEGWRITLFATNTPTGQLADLEVRHRLRARAEDRIRALKDLGLRNLPLHDTAQNRVWLTAVMLAQNLLTWTATLALGAHRATEPKRLRLRLLNVAARVLTTGRRVTLRLPAHWPWNTELLTAHQRLTGLPAPG